MCRLDFIGFFSSRIPISCDVIEENNGLAPCHWDSKTTASGIYRLFNHTVKKGSHSSRESIWNGIWKCEEKHGFSCYLFSILFLHNLRAKHKKGCSEDNWYTVNSYYYCYLYTHMKAGSCLLKKCVLFVSEKQKNYEISGHFKWYAFAQEITHSFL